MTLRRIRHRLMGLAAVVFQVVSAGPLAAEDLIPDPGFRVIRTSRGLDLPRWYTPHCDDAAGSDATKWVDRAIERRNEGNLLVVSRAATGLCFCSPPLMTTAGHAYMLAIGWDPRFGGAAAALVAHGRAGEILFSVSLRLQLLPDGRAFAGPLVAGPDDGPYLFPAIRSYQHPLAVQVESGRPVAMVRIDPLPAQVAYVDLHLSHGPDSATAAFSLVSFSDLSDGVVAVASRGLGPATVVAPDGVLLDPRWPPWNTPAAAALQFNVVAGEPQAVALLLPSMDGATELRGGELTRIDQGDEVSQVARNAKIEASCFSLGRSLAPSSGHLDTIAPSGVRWDEPTSGRLVVDVPEGTPAGVYSGTLELRSRGGLQRELRLKVGVVDPPISGNIVPEPGFERHRDRIPVGWTIKGTDASGSDDLDSRSGARSLLLAHVDDREEPVIATSSPCIPARTTRFAFAIAVRSEGRPAPFAVQLTDIGEVRIIPTETESGSVYRVQEASGFERLELTGEESSTRAGSSVLNGQPWLVIRAVVDLSGVSETRVRVIAWPSVERERSALRVDDVALRPLLTGFEEISRFERLTANPGFEIEALGLPRQPHSWRVAASEAGGDDYVVPGGDVLFDEPGRGRYARLRALGPGLELRSRLFRVGRGDRLVLAFRARAEGFPARSEALLRLFDRKGRALPHAIGVRLVAEEASDLRPVLLGNTTVRIDASDSRGFRTIETRILGIPEEAWFACLAFRRADGVEEESTFAFDDARVVPVRSPFVASGIDLDGYARRFHLRLWEADTDAAFLPVFEQLASYGLKPDVATPESFHDFLQPFPSVAPRIDAATTAERYASWGEWWWRRGFPVGLLDPATGDDDARVLTHLFDVWMPPLRSRGLSTLVWAPTPMASPCPDNPADFLRLDRWAKALSTVAPDLPRRVRPCLAVDAVSRGQLVGRATLWVVPPFDLRIEPEIASALLELREQGNPIWADLSPWLDRLDGPPAAPRAAVWLAWHLGFDGVAAAGATRWDESRLGSTLDGSLVVNPLIDSASGVLLWPAADRRLDPSRRLLQLAQGLRDVRLLRLLEELVGEAEGYALDVASDDLDHALARAYDALGAAHGVGSRPVRVASADELERARTTAANALAELSAVILVEREANLRR